MNYIIIDDYIFIDYMGFHQEKLSKYNSNFETILFNDLSGLVILDILMNTVSCNGFSKYSKSAVILTCLTDLVPYYISKVFVIVETEVDGVHNIPMSIKNKTTRTLSKFFDERHVDLYNLEF